jgi:hypothetical protein
VRVAAVTGGVIALVLGAGVASAAPGDADEIRGCYHKAIGLLRILDTGETCRRNETAVSWSRGGDAVDLSDGSVAGGPGGVVLDDSLTHEDLGDSSVRASELADAAVDTASLVAGSVKGGPGGVIDDGSITHDDLGSSSVGRDELAPGAVGTDQLSGGAVTTDKLTAGVAAAQSGPDTFSSVGNNNQFGGVVNSLTADVGANHKLLLLAQSQLTCTACLSDDAVEVSWGLYQGGRLVSEEYQATLTSARPDAVASVQALVADTGAAATRTYELRVTASSTFPATVQVSKDSMTALDLGR